jgi:hypothetical protein
LNIIESSGPGVLQKNTVLFHGDIGLLFQVEIDLRRQWEHRDKGDQEKMETHISKIGVEPAEDGGNESVFPADEYTGLKCC